MKEVLEYDIYLRIKKEDIHLITYLLEAEDNLMNIRQVTKEGLLKIICPKDTLKYTLELLNSLKDKAKLEVVRIEAHNGIV